MRREFSGQCRAVGVGFLLLTLVATVDCGGDFCVVTTPGLSAPQWTVTFAVTGTRRVRSVDAEVSAVIHCNGDCNCNSHCDCNAEWATDGAEPACEPLGDARFDGEVTGPRTIRFELSSENGFEADGTGQPALILECRYRSASEPAAGDFLIRPTDSPALSSGLEQEAPSVVVSGIVRR
jgi:hypothetical protein